MLMKWCDLSCALPQCPILSHKLFPYKSSYCALALTARRWIIRQNPELKLLFTCRMRRILYACRQAVHC